jgi:3-phytase
VAADIYRHGDPEGIMLYQCDPAGYWILTDQGATRSVFHLLDRNSFALIGSFAGEVTANTDGIWLDQREVPGIGQGILAALHDDRGVSAFAWEDIAQAFGLETSCER